MEGPGWRTVEFFSDLAEREFGSVTVRDLQIRDANSETMGYMSLIHRVTLEVAVGPSQTPKTLTFIVKEKSDKVFGSELVEIMDVFAKEREAYEQLLPAFEQLWSSKGDRFGPRLFKATDGPDTVLVMEDLNQSGYQMNPQRFGLPMAEVRCTLSKLAKFHAASVLHRETGGTVSDRFSDGIVTGKVTDRLRDYYGGFYSAFVQSLRERNLPVEYLTPLSQIDGRLLDECCRVLRFDATDLNVLNHGDLWPYNIMFSSTDVLFLDFPMAFYGCFATDVLYFLVTTATELMCDALPDLLEFYCRELVDSLQHLGYSKPLPSYNQLLGQVRKCGVLILPPLSEAIALCMVGMVEMDDIEKATAKTSEGEAIRRQIYSHPAYVTFVDRLIPKLFQLGLFSNLTEEAN